MTKNEYIYMICETVALKATCLKYKVGSVFISNDYEILATGYNGAPKGLPSCEDEGKCLLNDQGKCIRCTHSEINAIVQAAKRGTPLRGSSLYITHSPCISCANALINLGINAIYYKQYKGDSQALLNRAGIIIMPWENS